MQWKLAILILALSVLACNLGAPKQTDPETLPSPTLEPQPTTETPAPVVPSATPSPLPTGTFTATLPPARLSLESNPVTDENRIQFPTGGTWVEVGTHLEEGDSIKYVLTAMKGQVMSVSVKQSWPFSVEVADSTALLTEPNHERPFWRGTLPASQDYFITVKTQAAGNFTMRVAINPPGKANQYFDYKNRQETVTLRYSDEFASTTYIPAGEFKGVPTLVLEFIRPDFYSPTTNLGEACFLFSAMENTETVDTCTQPLPQLETVTGRKTFNGYDFTQSEAIGVGAGNIYDQVIYRTVYDSICYEVVFYMHSGNIGNYPPGTVVEFDRAALVQKFEQILSTFTVK
jgi:hypothetical protein